MSDDLTDYYCPTCGAGFDRLANCWAHECERHAVETVGGN